MKVISLSLEKVNEVKVGKGSDHDDRGVGIGEIVEGVGGGA